jgi:mannitol-1-/sugar-/sorbitol-6-phosphatase
VQPWRWSGAAVLFDMDGTLVDSGASVLRAWHWTAAELGLPFSAFEPFLHGIPADQVLARVAPSVAAERRAELAAAMLARQAMDTDGVVAVPGAAAALAAFTGSAGWAVVTSADRTLAEARIRAAGLPLPRRLITAELTPVGKPAPDPYLYAAHSLGVPPADCLVVEDSPAGVRSARSAGCPVLGVLTSAAELPGVDHAVPDLAEVGFSVDGTTVTVRLGSGRD